MPPQQRPQVSKKQMYNFYKMKGQSDTRRFASSFKRDTYKRIVIELAALFFLTYQLPTFSHDIMFNFLGVSDLAAVEQVFVVIASCLSVIYGILIAFLVITLEFNREIFAWHSVRKIFSNRHLRVFSSLYLGTIVFACLSLATTKSEIDGATIRLMYTTIGLFVLSIAILLPYIQKILHMSNDKEEIMRLSESIQHPQNTSYVTIQGLPFPSQQPEDSPLLVLAEVGVRSIRKNIKFTPAWVLNGCLGSLAIYLRENSGLDDERLREGIRRYLIVFREMGKEAVNCKDAVTFEDVLQCLYLLGDQLAKAQKDWPVYEDVYRLHIDLALKAINNDFEEGAITGVNKYMFLITTQWNNNCPEDSKPMEADLSDPKVMEKSVRLDLQWSQMSSRLVYDLGRLADAAIKERMSQVPRTLSSVYSQLYRAALNNAKMSDRQKDLVVSSLAYGLRNLYSNGLKAGILDDLRISLVLDYPDDLIVDSVIHGSLARLRLLKDMGDTYLEAADQNAISAFDLDEFRMLLYALIGKADNANVEKAAVYVIGILGKLRDHYAGKATRDRDSAELYLAAYDKLHSIHQWYTKGKLKHSKIRRKLTVELKKFEKLDKAKAFLNDGDPWKEVFG